MAASPGHLLMTAKHYLKGHTVNVHRLCKLNFLGHLKLYETKCRLQWGVTLWCLVLSALPLFKQSPIVGYTGCAQTHQLLIVDAPIVFLALL